MPKHRHPPKPVRRASKIMPTVYIDFETQSAADLKAVGGWQYSRHPSTRILCVAYAVDDGRVRLTLLDDHGYLGSRIAELAEDPETIFVAHNAGFEQAIWRNIMVPRYGFPEIPVERWRCTAAKAAYMSLPRKLEGVGEALGLPIQKDKEGHKVMLKLCKPRGGRKFKDQTVFWEYDDCPDDFETLYKYCMTDVETERLVDRALPPLNEREQRVWFLDQKINMRGIRCDVAAVQQVMKLIDRTTEDLIAEFQDLTSGMVSSPTKRAATAEWLSEGCGVEMPDMQKATVEKILKTDIPKDARRALEIRQQLSKSSTAKYTAMLAGADPDDHRLRDLFTYCAAGTHRWGGRRIQPQNLPRGTVKSDAAIDTIMLDDYEWFSDLYPDRFGAYSSCVRGMLVASPGCELFVADFASIEARVLAWLAGQTSSLDVFRSGGDPYCVEAGSIFGRPVSPADKYERSVGKVAVLALGYGGGINAFGTMCRSYGVDLRPAYDILWHTTSTDAREKAEFAYSGYVQRQLKAGDDDPLDKESGLAADIIKQRWRKKNKNVVMYWTLLEKAAIHAALSGERVSIKQYFADNPDDFNEKWPGLTFDGQDIIFGMMGEHLLCRLPSGNCLVYPFARVKMVENDWGDVKQTLTYKTQDDSNWAYGRKHTYGGKLAENVTQSVARDLLAEAMLRLDADGWDIALHVHDEVVAVVPVFGDMDARLKTFEQTVAQLPAWATGLPVAAEAWRGLRYRK